MKLYFITADPMQAETADAAGVDRIMVDLEITGKVERQGHLDTVISGHSLTDISVLRPIVQNAELTVRTNPLSDQSSTEIENIIQLGADRLMLPMFRSAREVQSFLELVQGRVPVTLLVETATALARLPQILSLDGIDDVHLGLNDLHLEMQLDFMFELFTGGIVDYFSNECSRNGIAFGIGGVAPVGSGMLPAELILAEHARNRSTRVILSRGFRPCIDQGIDNSREAVKTVRSTYQNMMTRDPDQIASDRELFDQKVQQISKS